MKLGGAAPGPSLFSSAHAFASSLVALMRVSSFNSTREEWA